jgi:hypothetical protein
MHIYAIESCGPAVMRPYKSGNDSNRFEIKTRKTVAYKLHMTKIPLFIGTGDRKNLVIELEDW